ncbi:MAG: hypothetical protein ACK4R2_02045 [Roseateles sp.]
MSRTAAAPIWPRLLSLLLGMVALASGLAGGLARIGWALPLPAAAAWHGPLMLGGLFGVVIGLERAVAIGRAWAYGSPLFAGAGTLALLAGEASAGFAGYAIGSALLLLATMAAARKQAEAFMGVLVLGALCGLLGHLLLAVGTPFQQTLLPLFAFLVLTIAGERLELSRYSPRPAQAPPLFAAVLLALLVALALPAPWDARLFGAALLGLAAWLARWDVARRTLRIQGLARFVAVSLLVGYVQLAIAGGLLLGLGLQPGQASYDGALHALGLGFVFSMVFGHAPLIAPALLRVRLGFSTWLYAPLALLHAGLLVRYAALLQGDVVLRRVAGAASAAAIALFLLLMLGLALRRPRKASIHAHHHTGAAPR